MQLIELAAPQRKARRGGWDFGPKSGPMFRFSPALQTPSSPFARAQRSFDLPTAFKTLIVLWFQLLEPKEHFMMECRCCFTPRTYFDLYPFS